MDNWFRFAIVPIMNTLLFLLLSRILFCGQVPICSSVNDQTACGQLKTINKVTKNTGVQFFFGKSILLILVTLVKGTYTFKKTSQHVQTDQVHCDHIKKHS